MPNLVFTDEKLGRILVGRLQNEIFRAVGWTARVLKLSKLQQSIATVKVGGKLDTNSGLAGYRFTDHEGKEQVRVFKTVRDRKVVTRSVAAKKELAVMPGTTEIFPKAPERSVLVPKRD